MIQYITFTETGPGSQILTQHNYQQILPGTLAPGVFDLDWSVVNTGNGFANVTLMRRAHTWNSIPLSQVTATIAKAYLKETDPHAVDIRAARLLDDPFDGIGLQVTHRLLNFHGDLIPYQGNMGEKVQRVGVDIYTLNTMALDGEWVDHHRFPIGDAFEPGTKITYQYWFTSGNGAKNLPSSGYAITKIITEVSDTERAVVVRKVPTQVEIQGVKVQPALGGAFSTEFHVRLDQGVWKKG